MDEVNHGSEIPGIILVFTTHQLSLGAYAASRPVLLRCWFV